MGQEVGKKGAAAVDLQPTIPKSDRLLESMPTLVPAEDHRPGSQREQDEQCNRRLTAVETKKWNMADERGL